MLSIALFAAIGAVAFAAEPSAKAIDTAALTGFPARPHSGFSLAIVHGDRITYEKGFGFRDDGTPDRYLAGDRNYYGLGVSRGATRRARSSGSGTRVTTPSCSVATSCVA